MSAAGSRFDDGNATVEFLTAGAESDGALHAMRATYVPDSSTPLPHFHPAQQEHYVIESGRLELRIDGEVTTVEAGAEAAEREGRTLYGHIGSRLATGPFVERTPRCTVR